MAFAHKVVRCTAFGTSFNGAEEWSTGFYMGVSGEDADAPNDLFLDAFLTAWETFFIKPDSYINAGWKTTGVKAVLVNLDGKTDLSSVKTKYAEVPKGGGMQGSPYPPQIALVATLVAGTGKELGGKGRMYLPGVNALVQGDGHIQTGQALTIATNLKNFLSDLNGSFDAPGSVINASQGRVGINGAAPINRVVTTVRVGNVFDTQRRRRNQLVEQYSSVPLGL